MKSEEAIHQILQVRHCSCRKYPVPSPPPTIGSSPNSPLLEPVQKKTPRDISPYGHEPQGFPLWSFLPIQHRANPQRIGYSPNWQIVAQCLNLVRGQSFAVLAHDDDTADVILPSQRRPSPGRTLRVCVQTQECYCDVLIRKEAYGLIVFSRLIGKILAYEQKDTNQSRDGWLL